MLAALRAPLVPPSESNSPFLFSANISFRQHISRWGWDAERGIGGYKTADPFLGEAGLAGRPCLAQGLGQGLGQGLAEAASTRPCIKCVLKGTLYAHCRGPGFPRPRARELLELLLHVDNTF